MLDELIDRELARSVLADRDSGAVDADRLGDGAQPRPTGEADVDDRVGAVDASAGGCEDALEHDTDRPRWQVAFEAHVAATIDPDLAPGVDHHLVDVGVEQVEVEQVEAGETGDGSGDQQLAFGGRDEWCHVIDLSGDDLAYVAVHPGGALAHGPHQLRHAIGG